MFATAPLPQAIEFTVLLNDLVAGHVRRRGLFLWPFVANGAPAAHKEFGFHVKMDRTSGGRLPKAKSDAAIVSEAPEESSRTAKPPLHHFNDKADVCARGDIRDKYRDNLRSIRADCCRL